MTCTSPAQRGDALAMPLTFADTIAPALDEIENAAVRLGKPGRPRTPIPRTLRRLIFMRDEFTCQWCSVRLPSPSIRRLLTSSDINAFHLDHITPHAAGGCDHAHNLRVLCRTCNESRSNHSTDHTARALPVTEQCTPCRQSALAELAEAADWDCDLPQPSRRPRLTAYCGTCRLVSWTDDESTLQ